MSAATLRSINCTQCGAPLTLHGGHRVESITCGFCGSVLDAHAEYKVIKTYTDLWRPPSPLAIGMQGRLKDVEFTIIGMVQYRDEWQGAWLDHALYSPTHGYAWLSYESGHFVFSRRVRDVPGSAVVPRTRARFAACGRVFEVHGRYRAEVAFVEGELTYVAEVGHSVQVLDGIDPPFVYSIERSEDEEEYSLGEYQDATEVYRAFGVDGVPTRPSTVHPAQPYRASALVRGLQAAGVVFAPIAALLVLYSLVLGGGSVLLDRDMRPAATAATGTAERELPFTVSAPGDLLSLEVQMPQATPWSSFDLRVLRNGEQVFSLDRLLASTASSADRGYWNSAGSRVQSYLRLPEAGNYVLRTEAGLTAAAASAATGAVRVTLREGIKLTRYHLGLLVLSLAALLAGPVAAWRFEARRWADEDDDDD